MAQLDNTYSKIVAGAKILLPLTALAILSTVFLVSNSVDPDPVLPVNDAELEDMLVNQSLRGPNASGLTDDGSSITIGAAQVSLDRNAPGRVNAAEMRLRIETALGEWIDVAAITGAIDEAGGIARLSGGVTIESSHSYVVFTETLIAFLDATRLETEDEAIATGPLGTVRAGKLLVHTAEDGRKLLDFTGGVLLLYTPRETSGGYP